MKAKSRFVKDNEGYFQCAYYDTVSGLTLGILTIGRGGPRRKGSKQKNVWHIFKDAPHVEGQESISVIKPSFKEAKQYLIENYPA